MRAKRWVTLLSSAAVGLLLVAHVHGGPATAGGGSVTDQDADGVPDMFDNCVNAANGPLAGPPACNQTDTDVDGYGNVCDSDFDNSGLVAGADTAALAAALGTTDALYDLDCDGRVLGTDVARHDSLLGAAPGPSGLPCAGTIPCEPL